MNQPQKNSKLRKPFDIGNSIVSASISGSGRVISLNTSNKKHGYVKLTPVKPFSNEDWYKPDKVRAYRNSFLSESIESKGFCLLFDFEKNEKAVDELPMHYMGNSNILYQKASYDKIEINKYFFIPPEKNFIVLLYDIENFSTNDLNAKFLLNGSFGITRASYGQITENGPIPIPKIKNIFTCEDSRTLLITEKGTYSKGFIKLIGESVEFDFKQKNLSLSIPLNIKTGGKVKLLRNSKVSLALVIGLSDSNYFYENNLDIEQIFIFMKETEEYWKKIAIKTGNEEFDYIINRNISYSYGCCCIRKNGAMITDHQSLPLTWNRDNYFMYKLLEVCYMINNNDDILNALSAHVDWLFTFILDNGWGRSHLTNGKIKDKVFQFDQQCYPILELYDFIQLTDVAPDILAKTLSKLDGISDILLSKKGKKITLFETEENPADDPVLYPYHFSTQVLAWRTFNILDIMNKKYGFSDKDYCQIAHEIKENVYEYMVTEDMGKEIFCYTTDLKGHYELYHDANDMPFALAPLWDFLSVDNEIFQNTVEWAFSDKNRGYYPGIYGGLGSDHAKGHWPLGSSQLLAVSLAMIRAENRNGNELWKRTISTLRNIAMKDGLFSESVFPDTGDVYTRYWFAWPGATISWLYLEKYLDEIRANN